MFNSTKKVCLLFKAKQFITHEKIFMWTMMRLKWVNEFNYLGYIRSILLLNTKINVREKRTYEHDNYEQCNCDRI